MGETGSIDLEEIVKTKWHLVFWNFIKRTIRKTTNVIKWIPVLWEDENWDYIFLLRIIRHKLQMMEDFFYSDRAYSAEAQIIGLDIKMTKKTVDRLLDNEYLDEALVEFEAAYPDYEYKLEFEESESHPGYCTIVDKDTKDQKELRRQCYEKSILAELKDFESLGKSLSNMQMWWD